MHSSHTLAHIITNTHYPPLFVPSKSIPPHPCQSTSKGRKKKNNRRNETNFPFSIEFTSPQCQSLFNSVQCSERKKGIGLLILIFTTYLSCIKKCIIILMVLRELLAYKPCLYFIIIFLLLYL